MSKDNFPKNKKDNSQRKYPGEGGPRPDHAAYKRETALERDAAWRKLTPQQQLAALDDRLGKGVGAERQRARLEAAIEKAKLRLKPESKGASSVGQLINSTNEPAPNAAKGRRTSK